MLDCYDHVVCGECGCHPDITFYCESADCLCGCVAGKFLVPNDGGKSFAERSKHWILTLDKEAMETSTDMSDLDDDSRWIFADRAVDEFNKKN